MRDKKFIYGVLIVVVFLLTVGLTYAYFSQTISGNDVAETINVDTTKLELKYTDGKEVKATNIEPGWIMTKTITVENTGNEEAYYTLGWQKLYNEIQKNELVIRSECTSSGVTDGICDNTNNVVIPQTSEVIAETNKVLYPYKEAALILPGETHTYTVTIEFINYTDKHQNYNQGKKFYGVLGIVPAYNTYNLTLNISNADGTPVANSEVTLHSTPMTGITDENGTVTFNDVELGDHSLEINKNSNIINTSIKLMGGTNSTIQTDSKYNVKVKKENIILNVKLADSDIDSLYIKGQRKCSGEVTANKFVDGQYTYTYNDSSGGWIAKLTDTTSTDPVTTEICYMINDKYMISLSKTFYTSKATSIDLNDFDTSKVINMSEAFSNSAAIEIKGLENFDTSNVFYMRNMFSYSQATTLDLSSFDTSNITDMSQMFSGSAAVELDLSSFNTSKVYNMNGMFFNSKATSLKGLSNFDTSKVTDMSHMFEDSRATSLDLSSFNTSKVKNMSGMFYGSKATSLDLSSFDTSKVTNMSQMFYNSKATNIIGLSNFNTSNVTNMSNMFSISKATSLDLSSFDTSKVTNMYEMFSWTQVTSLDLSGFDTSKVTNMKNMFSNSQATTLDLSSFDTTNVTNMTGMFTASKVTSGYARNQTEADKFNNLIGSNVFTVKN